MTKQINLGSITEDESKRINALRLKMSFDKGCFINQREMFFILFTEKEKEVFGENGPDFKALEIAKEQQEKKNKQRGFWTFYNKRIKGQTVERFKELGLDYTIQSDCDEFEEKTGKPVRP